MLVTGGDRKDEVGWGPSSRANLLPSPTDMLAFVVQAWCPMSLRAQVAPVAHNIIYGQRVSSLRVSSAIGTSACNLQSRA